MFDLTNVRSHWPLLSYINNPVKQIKHRLADFTFQELDERLKYDTRVYADGIQTTWRHFEDSMHALYARLSICYCSWENGAEVLSDRDIRKIALGVNYDIYEAFLHVLKLGEIFLPSIQRNSHLVSGYIEVMRDYMYRAHLSFPEEFAIGSRMITEISENEKLGFYDGACFPEIILKKQEFAYHQGTPVEFEVIKAAVEITHHYKDKHPSLGKLLELLRIIEITIQTLNSDSFYHKSEVEIQQILLTLMYTFERWETYTLATLLKDDQVLRSTYEEKNVNISYGIYRDTEISNLINPLIMTATSVN